MAAKLPATGGVAVSKFRFLALRDAHEPLPDWKRTSYVSRYFQSYAKPVKRLNPDESDESGHRLRFGFMNPGIG